MLQRAETNEKTEYGQTNKNQNVEKVFTKCLEWSSNRRVWLAYSARYRFLQAFISPTRQLAWLHTADKTAADTSSTQQHLPPTAPPVLSTSAGHPPTPAVPNSTWPPQNISAQQPFWHHNSVVSAHLAPQQQHQ